MELKKFTLEFLSFQKIRGGNMKKILDKILETMGCVIFSFMIVTSVWQVVSRYILKSPSTFSEEFLRFSLIWISMLGIAYVSGKMNHISIDFMKDRLGKKDVIYFGILVQLFFFLFAMFIMVIGGMRAVNISMYQISPALKVSMGMIYFSLPLSGVFIMIYSMINILNFKKELIKNKLKEKNSEKNEKKEEVYVDGIRG